MSDMGFHQLTTLREPLWERQDSETPRLFDRFETYLDQPRGRRNLAEIARHLGVRRQTIQEQASAHRWADRAAAFDAEQTRQHRERINDKAERLAERELDAAERAIEHARRSITAAMDAGEQLTPGELPRWMEAAFKLGESAARAPEHVRSVYRHAQTPEGGTATEVEVPEQLQGLEPAAQRERVTEMLDGLQRLAAYEEREQRQAATQLPQKPAS